MRNAEREILGKAKAVAEVSPLEKPSRVNDFLKEAEMLLEKRRISIEIWNRVLSIVTAKN